MTPNRRYCFGGPTRDQVKRIAWEDLKDLIPALLKKKTSESELWIKLVNGSEIWCIGFDRPERFEGTPWHGVVLTEFPHFTDTAWNENIAPALRDTHGWAILEGVPEGRNHYYDLVQYARESGDEEWADFCWTTAEVRDPKEIEKERGRLDERTFRQEYEGSFESYEGRAYMYYDATTHRKPVGFDAVHPVCVACDFNLNPCLWLIGQDTDGHIKVLDEIKMQQADIWKMCVELKRRLGGYERELQRTHPKQVLRVTFYGDYEHGKTRSVSATASSWEIIRSEFAGWNVDFHLRSHPRIVDRVNAVNSKLRTAKGQVQMTIDPKAVELHRDFEMVSMDDLGKTSDVGDRTHASDAVGYWIAFEYPVVKITGRQW